MSANPHDEAAKVVEHPVNDAVSFTSGAFWGRDPHEELTWLRRHAPVYWDGSVWGISKHADVKAVEGQADLFSNAGGIRPDSPPFPMMIDMDNPEHAQRRKLVARGFTPRSVGDSEPAVRRACAAIIDNVCERGECDFVTDIAAPLPMIMIGDALGVDPQDRDQLLEWSDDMLKALTGIEGDELMVRAADAFTGFSEYMARVIPDRRARPQDDLISTLVHAEVDGDVLDELSLVYESLLILIGGDETTRHVISGGMYELLRNPDQRQLLIDDPSLIPTAVEEMLRWVSPIKNMARTVTRDSEFRGQQLREGEKLLLLYPSANRDEDVFDDPHRFDVTRHPNEHVAFGFGVHFCLGSNLARMELRVMFEELLRRLPGMELATETAPPRRAANFVSGFESLPVRFSPGARSV